jgi:hypothetical protein
MTWASGAAAGQGSWSHAPRDQSKAGEADLGQAMWAVAVAGRGVNGRWGAERRGSRGLVMGLGAGAWELWNKSQEVEMAWRNGSSETLTCGRRSREGRL